MACMPRRAADLRKFPFFIKYWADQASGDPMRWIFFDGMQVRGRPYSATSICMRWGLQRWRACSGERMTSEPYSYNDRKHWVACERMQVCVSLADHVCREQIYALKVLRFACVWFWPLASVSFGQRQSCDNLHPVPGGLFWCNVWPGVKPCVLSELA